MRIVETNTYRNLQLCDWSGNSTNDVFLSAVHWNELPIYHVCWWEMIFQEKEWTEYNHCIDFLADKDRIKLVFQEYKSTPYQIEK